MKKFKIDGIIMATFLTTLFYASTYPYINKIIISNASSNLIAMNQIGNCLSIIIFSTLWKKYNDKLYKHFRFFCISETLSIISICILTILTENIIMYYILDTLFFCIITRNIICGGITLRANRYKKEKERVEFDNNDNIAASAATIIGSLIAMILKLDFNIMLIIATIGNMIDNVFYIVIYTRQQKKN